MVSYAKAIPLSSKQAFRFQIDGSYSRGRSTCQECNIQIFAQREFSSTKQNDIGAGQFAAFRHLLITGSLSCLLHCNTFCCLLYKHKLLLLHLLRFNFSFQLDMMSQVILPCAIITVTTASGLAASISWMVNIYGWRKWPTWSECTILLIILMVSKDCQKCSIYTRRVPRCNILKEPN